MFEQINSILNNREIATLLWIIVFLVWVAFKQFTFYKSVLNLLKASMRLWKIFLVMFLYITLSMFILYKFNLWNFGLIKVTIYWFFGWAFIMLINAQKFGNEKGYVKKIIGEVMGLAVVISFIAEFYTFPLWVEIFFVPFTVLLVGFAAVSELYERYKEVSKFMNSIIIISSFGILGINLYRAISNFKNFAVFSTLQEFLLPVLLSLMLLPFIYILSKYLVWESKSKMAKNQKRRELFNSNSIHGN